jgi:cytochrome b subunit of formate dehydrogenase
MKSIGYTVAVIIIILAISGWRIKRWINWEFSYGGRVDNRIELLEDRLDIVEKQLKDLTK